MTVARIKELMQYPTEENYRQIALALRQKPKIDNRPLAVQLGETIDRMSKGECFTLEEVQEIQAHLERFGLIDSE